MLAYTESHPDTSWIKIGAGLLSFRNGSWSKEGLSLGGDVELKYITLDHSGNPVVAGRISGGDDPTNLFISMWNGNAWTTIGNMHPAPSSASPQNINLAFNSNGDAFVAFFNAANDGVSVMKCTKGATEWTFLGGENPLGLKAYRLKLILDRQENPVLALDHSQTIQLAKYSGGAWSVAPGPAKSCGGSFGFAIDRGNNPILAFSNCGTTQVNIMSNVNGNWTGMGVTGVLPPQVTDVGQFDISIAPSGIPHLVFVDNANEERATVSKVAFDP
jgi:hypothetical protein